MKKKDAINLTAGILVIAAVLLGSVTIFRYQREQVRVVQVDSDQSSSDEAQITLNWMIAGGEYQAASEVENLFNEKLQEHLPSVKVNFLVEDPDRYKDEWTAAVQTGEEIDLAWLSNEDINFLDEIKNGTLMPVDSLLDENGEEIGRRITQEEWDKVTYEGNRYGIPVPGIEYQVSPGLVANAYYMDKYGDADLIKSVNNANPVTTEVCYEPFESFLQKMKETEGIKGGASALTFSMLADKGYEGVYGVDSPFVIRFDDKKAKVVNKYAEEPYRTYFAKMAEWYQKGYIRQDIASLLDPTADDGKTDGSILYVTEYSAGHAGMREVRTDYENIQIDLQKDLYISYNGARNAIVVPTTAQHPSEAISLLHLLYSDEGKSLYRLIVNGIENQHYIVLDNDTMVQMKDNDNRPLYMVSPYMIGNIYNNYEKEEGEFQTLVDRNGAAVRSPLIGFNLDTRMIDEKMIMEDLIVQDYKAELSAGYLENWEDVYDEFIDKMNQAGAQDIIQDMQRQIDKFISG